VTGEATSAVEAVVRESYGRLLAFLASQTSDIAAAEDALADALESAVRTWPERGVPERPESWMLTVARRSLIGGGRRQQVAERNQVELALRAAERDEEGPSSSVPDKRLELLFACAHPAIDASLHAPLMLQTVLGLDAARIAAAFLMAPTTLGQQLVRAKRKIKVAGVPFRVPGPGELPERAGSVADAIYAAYGTGWDDPIGDDERKVGLDWCRRRYGSSSSCASSCPRTPRPTAWPHCCGIPRRGGRRVALRTARWCRSRRRTPRAGRATTSPAATATCASRPRSARPGRGRCRP
jgi:RNA polymerase sigma-70 factor (ECF subfamily)